MNRISKRIEPQFCIDRTIDRDDRDRPFWDAARLACEIIALVGAIGALALGGYGLIDWLIRGLS